MGWENKGKDALEQESRMSSQNPLQKSNKATPVAQSKQSPAWKKCPQNPLRMPPEPIVNAPEPTADTK